MKSRVGGWWRFILATQLPVPSVGVECDILAGDNRWRLSRTCWLARHRVMPRESGGRVVKAIESHSWPWRISRSSEALAVMIWPYMLPGHKPPNNLPSEIITEKLAYTNVKSSVLLSEESKHGSNPTTQEANAQLNQTYSLCSLESKLV